MKIRNRFFRSYISFWATSSFTSDWLFFPKNFLFFRRFAFFFYLKSILFFSQIPLLFFCNVDLTGESVKIADFIFFRPIVLSFLGSNFSNGRSFPGRRSTFLVIESWAVEVNGWELFSGSISCSIRVSSSGLVSVLICSLVIASMCASFSAFNSRHGRSRSVSDIRRHKICVSKYLRIQGPNTRFSESEDDIFDVVARGRLVARMFGMSWIVMRCFLIGIHAS